MNRLAFSVAALCVCAAAARAIDFGALQPQGYLSDFANVVDADARRLVDRYCASLEHSTGAQLALVVVPTLGGEPPEDVANALFRKWGIGRKGENNGVLLLLSIADRRSRLEVGYGLEPVITDGDAGDILRAMRPYLRAGHYGDALISASNEIGSRIAKAKGVAIQPPAPREPVTGEPPVIVPLLFGGFFLFIFLAALIGGRRRRSVYGGFWPGFLLGNLMGGPAGSRSSGGGFGGFDSSDTFGGFGGGDSGGGGATSDW